ncbi:hypothetical protein FYJ51_11490 [Erysipelotrichaceae bacterium Oil+RF-744-GAM-WT-6]|uniref:Uncharacterized protein n=1 Tax=Stecheria intestinalis TaxID=2606630 RepID=A0A7X2NTZ5_9FIRM|nr:hypothetical protein [Stecheria intestinalis]MSS59515.1 hypothetical protein [Stecheria intestinalis]
MLNIWKIRDFRKAFFIEYTSNFDCKRDTGWWYCIKESPYIFEELKPKRKKNIRRALKHVNVNRESILDCLEELYNVYRKAEAGYENTDNNVSKDEFLKTYKGLANEKNKELWTGRSVEDNSLLGYMVCTVHSYYVETNVAKYDPDVMNLGASNAINHIILEEYLNKAEKKYINSGSRNINHKTNSMDYKIDTFNYRKAFCCLHLIYRPGFNAVVHVLYPFRNILMKFDNNTFVHHVNAVMKLEGIRRKCKGNMYKDI